MEVEQPRMAESKSIRASIEEEGMGC